MIPIVSSLKCYIFWKKSIDNRDFEEKKWLPGISIKAKHAKFDDFKYLK